jgi:N-acetylmuramoyl-L-alanine amidase
MNARLTSAAVVLVLASSLGACRTTAPIEPLPPAPPSSSTPAARASDRAPEWVGEPLSWSKLVDVEAWLATRDPSSDPFWKVEGEITLNQGRMELAKTEKNGQKASENATRARLFTSRAGLQRVVAGTEATADQKKRAEASLAQCNKLLGVQAAQPKLGLAVIPRARWGAMPANVSHMDKTRGGYRRITVHHSADREPPNLDGTVAKSAAEVRSIQKAHMEGKETGYADIGYHFVIDPYGRVFQGRELAFQGAHAAGANNVQNLGVCLIGNFDEEAPTKAALDALKKLLDEQRTIWKIPRSQVLTHQELKSTECPGRNLAKWVQAYRHAAGTPAPVEAAARAN